MRVCLWPLTLFFFCSLYLFQMHLVFYSSDYESFDVAQNRPQGLAVIGVLFRVCHLNLHGLLFNLLSTRLWENSRVTDELQLRHNK